MSSEKDPKTYSSSFEDPKRDHEQDSRSRGSFRREPPVVPERVAVMKANYKQAWLYFLLVVCLIVAWGIPIRYALIRMLAFRPADAGERTAVEFVAISYEGISDIPSEVSPERFREQMELLKERGYNAITLEEIKAFYNEGTPLPENAILLTFDHSRKSSYFDARRVLQKLGWHAVMFVWTKPILDEDPSALRWPYIRAMIGTGAWEAGAQSHLGFERIVADREGQLKNYLTSPRWITAEDRYETPLEYQARLHDDHEFVYEQILKETKEAPIAFAFPYGDFGQYDERAQLTRRLNMSLVNEFYDMAFIHGNAALNTHESDPMRLNRLLVNPEWTAEELLRQLDSAWPREAGVTNTEAMSDPLAWQVDWGGFELNGETATLHAFADNTGSKVWLNGTDLYRDFRGKFRLKIEKGQVGLLLRASKDGESFLYLGLGDQGEVWLRQKHEGLEPFTLGTSRYRQEPDGSINLEVYLRGNQFFATTGGEPVFDEIIMTRGEVSPGILGLSVWDPELGDASFDLLELDVKPFYNRMLTWVPIPSRLPDLAAWLGQNGYRYTHLSPPWIHLGDQGRAEQTAWNPNFYRELANVYNMQFMPEVIVERIDSTDMATAEKLALRAKSAGVDGVHCNLSLLKGAGNLSRITTWIQNTSKALERQGLELIVSLPRGLASTNSINSLLQGMTNLKIASPDDIINSLPDMEETNKRLVAWDATSFRRGEYPLYFQLSGGDASQEVWSTEVRSRILWEEGFDAYNAGKFEDAIAVWTRWSEVEPYNEKPLRLVGDVYLRNQEYFTAVSYYKKSLELDPGQVDLVLNTAIVQEKFLNKQDEAAQLLGLYHRLFPDNSDISLAQAGLFLRQGKSKAAGERIQEVATQNPDDLTALALMHPLLPTSRERMDNIHTINRLGRRLGMYEHFARTIKSYDLLKWPESWYLMDLITERALEESPDVDLYSSLTPRVTVVRENFKRGSASDNWWNATGPLRDEEPGSLFLGASPTSTEAALILKGSDTMGSGFMEVELEQARGFFWLYARRSEGNMIRFGFEPDGQLYLQIWHNNVVVTNETRKWERPLERVRLRLEVRGEAVFGYLDGRPAFGAPILIPKDMNLGWWGLAPWSPQFGMAQALVREVAGGPLPVNIGMYRGFMDEDVDEVLVDKLKGNSTQLTVFSPNWFFQDVKGDLRSEIDFDLPGVRLLTRYYKIRLYPLIRSSSTNSLKVEQLVQLAEANKVEGFTLDFARMPDEEWFAKMEDELVGTGIGLLVIRVDSHDNIAEVRELGSILSLTAGKRETKEFEMVNFSKMEKPIIPVLESMPQPPAPSVTKVVEVNPKTGEAEVALDPATVSSTDAAAESSAEEVAEPAPVVVVEPAPEPERPPVVMPSVTRPKVPSKVYLF